MCTLKVWTSITNYAMFLFHLWKSSHRSCTYIDGGGGTHDVDLSDIEASRSDLLCKIIKITFFSDVFQYRNLQKSWRRKTWPILWNFPKVVVSPQTWRLLTHTRRWRPYRNCFRCRNDVLHFVWQISNYSVSVLNLLSSWLRYIDVVPIFVNKKKKRKRILMLCSIYPRYVVVLAYGSNFILSHQMPSSLQHHFLKN